MNHQTISSLTAALLVSLAAAAQAQTTEAASSLDVSPVASASELRLGVPSVETIPIPDLELAAEPIAEATTPAAESEIIPDGQPAANRVGQSSTDQASRHNITNADAAEAPLAEALTPSLVQVSAHALDREPAATLYLSDIPLLTFVGEVADVPNSPNSTDKAAAAGLPAVTAGDPVVRANAFGSHLEQLYQQGLDPEAITARWNAETERFEVMLDGAALVVLDTQTRLPDTTDNLAEDTLQVTNRLRRLLGGADPVAAIEGRPRPETQTVAVRSAGSGLASWYGPGFHGRRSASGEVFNQNALTAAHRTLPFGTRVCVTNVNTGQQVIVRINDRGPFSGGRVIDLSAAAAGAIGLRSAGVGPVQLEVLGN